MKKLTTKSTSRKSSAHPSIRIQDFFRPLKDNAFDSLFFTDNGQVFRLKKWNVNEGTRLFNNQTISKLIKIPKNLKIVAVLSFRPLQDKYKYLYMCTKKGQVKKTKFSEYSSVRQTGQIAILLDADDSVGWVNLTKGEDDLMIISQDGQSIRFKENEIKSSHRDTLGVRGIKLSQNDVVASSFLIKNHRPDKVLIVTEEGKGKLSPLSAWSRQLHGGIGIKAAQINHKTGPVIHAQVVSKKINTLLIATDNERLIKVGMRKVPTLQRQTQGNRLIKLRQNEKVKNAIAISTKELRSEFSYNDTYVATENTGSTYNPHLRYAQLQKPNMILRFSRNNSIGVLGLPTRLENALRKEDILRLGELYDYPEKKLYKIENLGVKSVGYILSIKSNLIFGVGSEESSLIPQVESATPNLTPIQLIDFLIKRCGDSRHTEIIQRRYGLLNGEIETLEEIGESFNITRERVRQIQKKAIKKMQHPSNLSRKSIINIIEQLFIENDYLISDEEADKQIPMIFNKLPYDGSSLLDLFVDLGWVQRHRVGDVSFYSTISLKIELSVLIESIVKILRKNILPVSLNELLADIPTQQATVHKSINSIVLKCCKSDPRIEDGANGKFTLYKNNRKLGKWIPSITKVLEDEGEPLHFTEISEKVNDLLASQNARLDQRRTHSLLIGNPDFAHTGIKGTYGLTKWGIRKESTLELVKEYITNAGFPVHWEQIYNYVSKYKYTSEGTMRALLYSKFENVGNGLYTIKR